jgi:hypothetical protein
MEVLTEAEAVGSVTEILDKGVFEQMWVGGTVVEAVLVVV